MQLGSQFLLRIRITAEWVVGHDLFAADARRVSGGIKSAHETESSSTPQHHGMPTSRACPLYQLKADSRPGHLVPVGEDPAFAHNAFALLDWIDCRDSFRGFDALALLEIKDCVVAKKD
jgi:hypothetical protein